MMGCARFGRHDKRVKAVLRTDELTVKDLRAALGYLGWTRERLAEESGVSPATIYRMLSRDGPIPGRPASVARVIEAISDAGAFKRSETDGPAPRTIQVELDVEIIRLLPVEFEVIGRLWEASGKTRDQDALIERMQGGHGRLVCIYEANDGELRFDYMGPDLPWGQTEYMDRSLFEVLDHGMAQIATERILKAMITGQPILAFCHQKNNDYTVLTVPSMIGRRPGVVSVSQPSRPTLIR